VVEEKLAREGEGVGGGFGGDEGIAVAVAADPRAEGDDQRDVDAGQRVFVLGLEGDGDLVVEDGDGLEDGFVVIVEGHPDFVADGGAGGADVVGLPEGGNFSEQRGFE